MNELIIIILASLITGLVWWYQDKKKKEEEELSNRLYQAENNITRLNNVKYKRGK